MIYEAEMNKDVDANSKLYDASTINEREKKKGDVSQNDSAEVCGDPDVDGGHRCESYRAFARHDVVSEVVQGIEARVYRHTDFDAHMWPI